MQGPVADLGARGQHAILKIPANFLVMFYF